MRISDSCFMLPQRHFISKLPSSKTVLIDYETRRRLVEKFENVTRRNHSSHRRIYYGCETCEFNKSKSSVHVGTIEHRLLRPTAILLRSK